MIENNNEQVKKEKLKFSQNAKAKRIVADTFIYIFLSLLAILWLIPILWIVLTSFSSWYVSIPYKFFPDNYTLQNFVYIFTDTTYLNFPQMMLNTFIVSCATCLVSTFMVISVAYVISKIRFTFRRKFMNIAMILGMFPGFMSMVAIYNILKLFNLTQTLYALIIVYSAGAGLGFYIAKGFFDTIPITLNEAARVDGASNATIFFKIVLPLSKPIVVYTVLTSFMGPWGDFIFASVILRDSSQYYTVPIGLYNLVYGSNPNLSLYPYFAAGCVVVAIPITTLFIIMQRYYVGGVTGGAVKG